MNAPGDPSFQATQPTFMTYAPMTFGQALDRVFRLLKAHWKLFLAIATVPAATYAIFFGCFFAFVLVAVQPWSQPNPAKLIAHIGLLMTLMAIGELATLAAYALYQPAASYAALQADAGVSVSFRDAYARAWSRFGRYLWLLILKCLILMAPILVFAAIVGGTLLVSQHGRVDPNAAFLLFPMIMVLYALSAAYMIVAMIWMAFSYPVSIAEDLTAAASISRSVKLTKGARVKIFLLALVIYAICYAASLAIECVLVVVIGVIVLAGIALHLAMNPWGFVGIGIGAICFFVLFFFWTACFSAAYSSTFAVLYRNQRLCEQRTGPTLT